MLSSENEDKGNDCLYVVIADIVNNHNQIIWDMLQANTNKLLEGLVPEPSKILPAEFDSNTALIGGFSE